jgi:predicted permease
MTEPTRLFRLLLRLYPASFRAEYGGELWRVFVERRRDAGGLLATMALWLSTIVDTVFSAAHSHWDISKQDLRYALRTMRRAPGFTATVMLVTALGIGANAAAFSLTDYVLLRPLPFRDASCLVVMWQSLRGRGTNELSPANYRDWKAASSSFEGMAASWSISANLVGQGDPERLEGAAVTADLLPLLGVQPAIGRAFTADDDREGAPGTVLLAWGLWQTAFGGDTGVLGRKVTLDGEPYVVIGVMPPSFAYPGREAQFWKPMRFRAGAYDDRSDTFLRVVARLEPGVTMAQARAELDVISENLERAWPKDNEGVRATIASMRDQMSQAARLLVLALSGAAACVLLIACLNLANLLLARALVRRKELALRAALGAGRERLVRQLLTESLLLALGGGVLGVLLAMAALPVLTRLVPAALPIAATPAMDLRVLAVAAGVTVFAGIAFGVVPSLRVCRTVDADGLREGSRAGTSGRRARLVRAVVVAEVCASLVLLVGAGLLLRTLWRVQARDPGFHAEGVLTLRTWLPWPKYQKTSDRVQFYDRVLTQTRALPGVTGAAYISGLPMAMGGGIWSVAIPGRPPVENERRSVSLRFVTPDYFSVMQVPVRAGRDVSEADTGDRAPVAVVSESFVRRYWPGQNPIGKQFKVAFADRTVVGVAGDVRVRGLESDSEPQVYLPYKQVPDGSLMSYPPKDLLVRSTMEAATLVPALRAIVREVDPQQPISNVRPLEDVVAAQTAPRRVQLYVLGTFAALAFLLAGIGIYGLLSFAVSNRAQEIGVRMALGATPGSILQMVLREGLLLAAVGAVAGVGLAYVAGRSLEALLVGVTPTDGPTLACALAIVLVMTLIGSGVPAWRAARVDPATVMRAD